ncbi:MAG: class I SAM-dependent methyltransferase [Chloroflexota bacterium]
MKRHDTIWQTTTTTNTYLADVRGAIPLAHEQIDVMLRLIRAARGDEGATAVLDLGCGNGILGQAVIDQYPNAQALFIDFSAPMLAAAKQRLAKYERASFLQVDYGDKNWRLEIGEWAMDTMQSPIPNQPISNRFDIIVSGFSIHHQPDERKREIYQEIFELLRPGGIFLNLEHVQSATPWIEAQHDELFIDHMHVYQQEQGGTLTRTAVSTDYHARSDKIANILAPVEIQCNWLREIGFAHVDIFLKIFELALFGGLKPK